MDRWIRFVVRARWAMAVLWLVIAAGSVWTLPRLEFRFDLGQSLRGDESRLDEIREFYATFPPSDGHLMVTATSPAPLTLEDLRAAERWAEEYRALPEVETAISPGLLLERTSPAILADREDRAASGQSDAPELDDLPGMGTFRGSLVSHDGKSVALYLIKPGDVSVWRLLEAVRSVEAKPWENAETRVIGVDLFHARMGTLLSENFRAILLFEILAILVVTPLVLRSFRRAYLPFLAALTALAFYLALFVLAGRQFGVTHLAGPGLILVIGLADAIHLQQRFDDARAAGQSVVASLRVMYRSVGHACVLTSLTTACGFLSLLAARHEEIREFGLWCAVGVAVAFAIVIVFLPVALVFFPGTGSRAGVRSPIQPRLLRRFVVPVAVLFVVLVAGAHRTRFDTSLERELPRNVDVVRDAKWFGEHFRGLDRIEIDLHANLRDPEVFALVDRMQNELRGAPGISGSQSYVDAVRIALLPEELEVAEGPSFGLAALVSKGMLPTHLLTEDFSRACIVFYRTREFGTELYEDFRDRVGEFARELPEGASMKLNGHFPQYYDSAILISETMVRSLACSVAMITAILMLVLRSVKLGLLCLAPNALPLLVVAGLMGWIGEPLHLGILLVFSVGLGLAVDDTIHILTRFRQLRAERPEEGLRELMGEAVASAGFAVTLASAVLLISAMCFLGSDFTTIRWIGVTLGIVAVSAWLADLILLPWLMERFSLYD